MRLLWPLSGRIYTHPDVQFRQATSLAHEALLLEDKVGTMLPCNVVVQAAGDGVTEVAAIDPVASMRAIDNPALLKAAEGVRSRLAKVVQSL